MFTLLFWPLLCWLGTEETCDDGCGSPKHQAFSFGERVHFSAQVRRLGSGQQAWERLRHGLPAQPEGVEVHGDHGSGPKIDEGLEGFLRAGVHGAVAVRKVSADWQQRDLRTEPVGDVMEAVEVRRIPGVVEGRPARRRERVAAIARDGCL